MTIDDLLALGGEAGGLLRSAGQSIAVVDGSTGGLISTALVAPAGASAWFRGGGVIYTLKGRRAILGHEPGSLRGLTSATEDYALAQAELVAARFGADWGLAETGAAGPGAHPLGVASGTSAIGLFGPHGKVALTVRTGSDDRLANMTAFARAALMLLRDTLQRYSIV